MSYSSEAFTIAERESEQAGRRIIATSDMHGGQEPAAVGWLLSFLTLHINKLSIHEQDELWGEVIRFCIDAGQGNTQLGRVGGVQFEFRTTETAADRMRLVSKIQEETRAVLDSYLKTGQGKFPKGEGEFTLLRGSWLVPGDQPLRYKGGDLPSCFYYMAAYLLARYGQRVKHCKGCPVIMLAGRKDKRFHSQSCQIATFARKDRAKKKAKRLAQEQARTARERKRKSKAGSYKGGKRHGTKR